MKYLAIEFSNEYTNRFRNPLDILNNELLISKLKYNSPFDATIFNEYPMWTVYVANMVGSSSPLHLYAGTPEQVIKEIELKQPEYVFFSEMEITADAIREVINTIDNDSIKFIIGSRNGSFKSSNKIKVIKNINDLNKIFNLGRSNRLTTIPINSSIKYGSPNRIYLTNGCNNKCSFCTINNKVTKVDDNTIYDLFNLLNTHSTYVYIGDLTFGQELDWEIEWLKKYNHFKKYIVQTTVEMIINNVTKLQNWYDSGIRYVELGIETFNQATLNKFGKHFTITEAYKAIDYLNEVGIKVIPNIMLNIKGEVYGNRNITLSSLTELAESSKINHINITNYTNYRSKIYNDRQQSALIKTWNTTQDEILEVYLSAMEIYKLNYKLLTNQ